MNPCCEPICHGNIKFKCPAFFTPHLKGGKFEFDIIILFAFKDAYIVPAFPRMYVLAKLDGKEGGFEGEEEWEGEEGGGAGGGEQGCGIDPET